MKHLTHQRLTEVLRYDCEAGVFFWLVNKGSNARVGQIAGRQTNQGYMSITLDGAEYSVHRLAWFYVYGAWPTDQIDHINQIKVDNRISNLRSVTNAVNQQNNRAQSNNKSGLLGVHLCKRDNKWKAQIRAGGKNLYLGRFDTAGQAHAAYVTAKRELHPGCTI